MPVRPRLIPQVRIALAGIAVAIFGAGLSMSGVESEFWGVVFCVVAFTLVLVAVFYNRVDLWWQRRRLRGIRFSQRSFNNRPTEVRIMPDVPVDGLLIVCSPESAVIGEPTAKVRHRNAVGRHRTSDVIAVIGLGNRVAIQVSNVDAVTGEYLKTTVDVTLAVGVVVETVEPLTGEASKAFTTDQQ